MSNITRRELHKAAAAAALGLAGLPASAADETPRRGGPLRYAQCSANRRSSDATNARHPYFMVDSNTRLQYNCLTWVNEKLEVELELAREISPTDEKLNTWDVTLREGVMFHNGREMVGDDVAASFALHRVKAAFAQQVDRCEVLGKHKVRFHLWAGNSEFPYILAEYDNVILPADTPEKIGMAGIGTGPFKIVSTDPAPSMIMERNENYWRKGFPYLDRLEIHNREGQQEAALNGLRARQFEVVLNIDPRAVRQLESEPDMDISSGIGGYHFVIQLPKHAGSPSEDKRIRQAFALAIDREAIVRIVYNTKAGWVGNDSHLVVTDPAFLPRPVKRDVARAKQLLAEAGFPNGITLPTLYFSPQLPEVPRYFQVLQQTVKDAGITLPIEERPNDGYFNFRRGDNDVSKGNFHKFAMTAVGSRNPGISLFRMRNDFVESGHWRGPEHDRYMQLYQRAMVTRDAVQRKTMYQDMHRILHEEVPAVLPAGGNTYLVKRKSVRNLSFHPQIWSVKFDQVWLAA
jgi:peptide/nickel transport system substrate-binding protein